jgi:hypothetical protein
VTGATGAAGTAGQSAATTVTTAYTQPAINADVTVNVASVGVFGPGLTVHVANVGTGASAGYYKVNSVGPGNVLSLKFLGYTGSMQSAGTTVISGSVVSAAGVKGADGTNGTNGTNGANGETIAPRAFVSAVYAQPAVGGTVTIPVTDTRWMIVGQIISVGPNDYYEITAVINQTNVTIKNLNYPGSAAPGSGIANGHGVGIAGKIGLTGAAGANGAPGAAGTNGLTIYPIATVNTAFTQPAVNATVSANISDTRWMAIGTIIHINGANFYKVTGLPAASTAVLLNLGYPGSASPGTVISVGLEAGLTGIQGPTGNAGAAGAAGAVGPAGPQIAGLVRGNTEQTRALILSTLNQNLPSGFYSINASTEAQRVSMGCPVTNWGYVIVNHHENGSADSGNYQKQTFHSIESNRRWYRDVYNGGYGAWQPDYLAPYAMSQATFNARDFRPISGITSTGDLVYCSLGAFKGALALSTSQIPNQGGVPN